MKPPFLAAGVRKGALDDGLYRWRAALVLLLVILFLALEPREILAGIWTTDGAHYKEIHYDLRSLSDFDLSQTTAVLEGVSDPQPFHYQIKLPLAPASLSWLPVDGAPGYAVIQGDTVQSYTYAESGMILNDSLSLPARDLQGLNPVGLATGGTGLDMMVAGYGDSKPESMAVRRYVFDPGQGKMVPDSTFAVTGLQDVLHLGLWEGGGELSFLHDDLAGSLTNLVYGRGDQGATEIPFIEIHDTLYNPLALACRTATGGGYEAALLVRSQDGAPLVRYYKFNPATGQMAEDPGLQITGLSDPRLVALSAGGDVAVIDGRSLERYTFDGSHFQYNSVLSLPEKFTNPAGLVLVPGKMDVAVLDGTQIRYFAFNEDTGALVEKAEYEATLGEGPFYHPLRRVRGAGAGAGVQADAARLRLDQCQLPPGTKLKFRLGGGGTWKDAGEVAAGSGNLMSDFVELNQVPDDPRGAPSQPVGNLAWEIWLYSDGGKLSTPVIRPDAVLEARQRPRIVNLTLKQFDGRGPRLEWTFEDPNPGPIKSTQAAYQIMVYDGEGGKWDTGIISSPKGSSLLPEDLPGIPVDTPLTFYVRVWDATDGGLRLSSNWASVSGTIEPQFYNLRVTGVTGAPPGWSPQNLPWPEDPDNHQVSGGVPPSVTLEVAVDAFGLSASDGVTGYYTSTGSDGLPLKDDAGNVMPEEVSVTFNLNVREGNRSTWSGRVPVSGLLSSDPESGVYLLLTGKAGPDGREIRYPEKYDPGSGSRVWAARKGEVPTHTNPPDTTPVPDYLYYLGDGGRVPPWVKVAGIKGRWAVILFGPASSG
ncbi:MAG: hypothetical protein PWP70_35 [Moorella sp. (in: firmicutes)]|nr:hypothetical protein [Moorella sp. (in: firmicutes)]